MHNLFLLIRPWQWTKNLFIFLPLFFSLQLNNFNLLVKAGMACAIFCLLASGIYIFNDYYDIKEDQKHPKKKRRPLAAGTVTVKSALTVGFLLTVAGLFGAVLLDAATLYLALLYLMLNISYTIKLKHISLLDVFIIALGFVIRILVGGVVTGVKIYPWIIIMTFLLTFFLALGKRREDVLLFLNKGERVRKSIDGYTLNFIDNIMVAMAAITIVFYLTYTMSSEIIIKFKTDQLYLTTVFVIWGILRYLQITMVEQRLFDPVEILITDPFIQMAIIGWITMFSLLIYL